MMLVKKTVSYLVSVWQMWGLVLILGPGFGISRVLAVESENLQVYELVIDYVKAKDGSRPIGLYLKNEEPIVRYPGPTLFFEEGQTAVIRVYNRLSEETSIHWHGIILPNAQDGVPYITTKPIPPFNPNKPERYFEYKFKIVQSGTYWYHSHSALQEQRGLFGSIVIFPADTGDSGHQHHQMADYDQVVDFSDHLDRSADQVMANLKGDNELESRRKGTERSLYRDMKEGTLWKRLKCETNGMGPMDIADVALDAIKANGLRRSSLVTSAGVSEKVKLRLINSAASSFIQVKYGQGRPMKIVASDGLDVTPHEVTEILMGVGETYDVIVDSAPDRAVELRGTVFDINPDKYSSTIIGPENTRVEQVSAYPVLNPCDHHAANLVYNDIRSLMQVHERWKWPEHAPVKEFHLKMTGDMRPNRYVWSMDGGKVFADTDPLVIRKGEHVKIHLTNDTMMFHPIHLHGHFFAVTSTGSSHGGGHGDHGGGHGDAAPVLWKHTIILAPHSEQTIEFYANEDRNWLFHCHNMYHMAAGMSLMFSYTTEEGVHGGGHQHGANEAMIGNPNGQPNLAVDQNTRNKARELITAHPEMGGKSAGYMSYEITPMTNQTEGKATINLNDKASATFSGKYGYKDGDNRKRLDLSYHPNLGSYWGVYGAVEDMKSSRDQGLYGAAGVTFKVFSVDGNLGYGTKGIDACVSRDIPLIGKVYFYGRYCRQGRSDYYDAALGYHIQVKEGGGPINIDPVCGLNEDGVMCGVKIHGSTEVKKPRLFEDLQSEQEHRH